MWLFASPWIFAGNYGAYGNSSAWNSWIVGALIVVFARMRMNQPAATRLSWFNSMLGIWIVISPWIYGYTGNGNTGRFVNSLVVGFIIFCAALAGANSERMSHDRTSTV
jgi:hypothetical protein